jgi:hypothetical protein
VVATLPPEVERLAWLLGTWRGEGRGGYPSIDDFAYVDETVFECDRKPRVDYLQRTRLADGVPSHSERGFLRVPAGGAVEAVITTGGGTVEIDAGTVTGTRLELASTHVAGTPSAKEVRALHRVFELDEAGVLHVRVDMEAVGQSMGFHVEARLERS